VNVKPSTHTRATRPKSNRVQHPRCINQSSKEPAPDNPIKEPPRDEVSTYLALTFGTLLSSQGTDASRQKDLTPADPHTSTEVRADLIRDEIP
jgi:hypothetical protein